MGQLKIKQFLESGVHFGHQTKKWNPKMAPFIFGEKNRIHIIDLQKTLKCTEKALDFIEETAANGEEILFVGTKRQAQVSVAGEAQRSKSFFISQRWLGGMLTNFSTIKLSIGKMNRIKKMVDDNDFGNFTKKEANSLKKDLAKLEKNLSGIKEMRGTPGAVFIVDPKREHIALQEARKLKIPTIVLVDTNCDPEGINYPIPANDDAIRSINLFCSLVADAILRGKARAPEKPKKASEKEAAPEVQPEVPVEAKEKTEVPVEVPADKEAEEVASLGNDNSKK